MAHIIVVDDDPQISRAISAVAGKDGHTTEEALTYEEGLEQIERGECDVVFLDVRLPDGNGLDMLPRIQSQADPPEVIIITGFGDTDGAELAVKSGVWDYLQKPSSARQIKLTLNRAVQYRDKKVPRKSSDTLNRNGIIGHNTQLLSALDKAAQASETEANVLITGQTGAGKELIALAVHNNSSRSSHNFVVVDCAALPENLVESVLFGHVKGAFTGADKYRDGLIKQADGGTLFLDEVGELPFSIQKSFLRVLQEKRFRPVGAKQEVTSRFRLVSATNRNLDQMVEEGRFREDLLFRLRTIVIELPSLRQMKSDIPELISYYLKKFFRKYGTGMKKTSPEFVEILTNYSWPGNVRELIQAMERSISAAQYDPVLYPKHLPDHIRIAALKSALGGEGGEDAAYPGYDNPEDMPPIQDIREFAVDRVEKKYLQDLMAFTKGRIKDSCRISGLSRSRLYTLLKKHGVFKPR
jgi:two-component system, NtrC family, response regulator